MEEQPRVMEGMREPVSCPDLTEEGDARRDGWHP